MPYDSDSQDSEQNSQNSFPSDVTIFSSTSSEVLVTNVDSQSMPTADSPSDPTESIPNQSVDDLSPAAIAGMAAYQENQRVENEIEAKKQANGTISQSTPAEHRYQQTEPPASMANPVSINNPPAENIPISVIKIKPSVTLLVFRLLGLGLVLIFFLFILGLGVDLISFAFGGNLFPILNNRSFTLTLGMVLYIVIGFVFYKQWDATVYTLDPTKIIFDRGWIFKNRQTRDISQFGGVRVTQTALGKLLNYGDLRLEYHGAIGKVAGETMADIPDPFWHEQMLYRMISPQESS